jgi:anti-sigma regulatory factor (Ser/Thr protein kinase)
MCRSALLELEPTPQAVGAARRFVADTCRRWQIQAVSDEISLAVSELVTNAVLHAHTHIQVTMCVTRGSAQISVRDSDPRPPILRPVRLDLLADLDAVPAQGVGREIDERDSVLHVGTSGSVAAGRGLLIVDALADEWGVAERTDGKEVWLTMLVPWERPEPCPCDPSGTTPAGAGCRHIPGPWDEPT